MTDKMAMETVEKFIHGPNLLEVTVCISKDRMFFMQKGRKHFTQFSIILLLKQRQLLLKLKRFSLCLQGL